MFTLWPLELTFFSKWFKLGLDECSDRKRTLKQWRHQGRLLCGVTWLVVWSGGDRWWGVTAHTQPLSRARRELSLDLSRRAGQWSRLCWTHYLVSSARKPPLYTRYCFDASECGEIPHGLAKKLSQKVGRITGNVIILFQSEYYWWWLCCNSFSFL